MKRLATLLARLDRWVRYHHCIYVIRHHQAELDAIAMQREQDEADAAAIAGRIARHKHRARALREAA
jgi:predicted fused transcriptional regulator/phosphomethylpyrimidine kinase